MVSHDARASAGRTGGTLGVLGEIVSMRMDVQSCHRCYLSRCSSTGAFNWRQLRCRLSKHSLWKHLSRFINEKQINLKNKTITTEEKPEFCVFSTSCSTENVH